MSRTKGTTVEFGYLFPDEPATIYLQLDRSGDRYGYGDTARLEIEGWSEQNPPTSSADEDA